MKSVSNLARLALVLGLIAGCSASGITDRAPDLSTSPYKQKALALESEGSLRQALDAWKVVLTLYPNDSDAKERKDKLELTIKQLVAERMKQGDQALQRKAFLEARKYYLDVLALDPYNAAAFDVLRSKIKEVRTLSHTVRRGETLASIAEQYYGDRSRSEVIWETNQLPPNPKLVEGSALLIPEIPGVPFVNQQPSRPALPQGGAAPVAPKSEVETEDTTYDNPLLSDAKDALESGDFAAALSGVEKFLAGNPKNVAGLDLKKQALYQQGKTLLSQKKYQESLKSFDQLAKLAPNYQDSNTLSGKARNQFVQDNYTEGIRLFREEKLRDAVARWRTVLEYQPNHAGAKKNIEQAERLIQSLEQRQQGK